MTSFVVCGLDLVVCLFGCLAVCLVWIYGCLCLWWFGLCLLVVGCLGCVAFTFVVWLVRMVVMFINLLVFQFNSLACAIVLFGAGL